MTDGQWLKIKDSLAGLPVVVVGAGRSGMGAARLARRKGARVRILDRNRPNPARAQGLTAEGIDCLWGVHRPEHFAGAQLVILSPGVNPRTLQGCLPRDVPVVGELEFASWFVGQEIIVGVTGSNGKTTTVGLIAHILEHGGKKVFLGGNYGPPLSEYVLASVKADVLVLELSSFQLAQTRAFRPQLAVFLNFSPNHLDYHQDEEEYLRAKMQIFARQRPRDTAIFDRKLQERMAGFALKAGRQIMIQSGPVFSCPALSGGHNRRNIQAAALVCKQLGVDDRLIGPALEDFCPKPHRLQFVGEYAGIRFIDDSKATTVAALEAALQSFVQPVLLLAGGRFKGGDLTGLRALIREKVRLVALFGESRELFSRAWQGCADLSWSPTLEEAALYLFARARQGEVVLLSPATASFDLFAGYKERGMAFQQAVDRWIKQCRAENSAC